MTFALFVLLNRDYLSVYLRLSNLLTKAKSFNGIINDVKRDCNDVSPPLIIIIVQCTVSDSMLCVCSMNALKVLTLAACMGTAQKTVPMPPSMHELQQLCFWLYVHDNFGMKLTEE